MSKVELEIDDLEMNQLEAALLDRLSAMAKAECKQDAGTLEEGAVIHAIRYTGSLLTKVQIAIHGVDEPDEPEWGALSSLLPREPILTPGELTELWGK